MRHRRESETDEELDEMEARHWEAMLLRHAAETDWPGADLADLAREKLLALGRQPPLTGGRHGLN